MDALTVLVIVGLVGFVGFLLWMVYKTRGGIDMDVFDDD